MSINKVFENCGLKSQHFLGVDINDDFWTTMDDLDAACDTPIPYLFEELDQRYEGSKFILTVRDLDSWLKSMRWMLTDGAVLWRYGIAMDAYHDKFYGTHSYNESKLIDHWNEYHQRVRDYFAGKDQLLEIKTNDLSTAAVAQFLQIDEFVDESPLRNKRKKPKFKQVLKFKFDRFLNRIP